MKITAFPADDGDCFLLQSGQRRILIDGGRRGPFGRHALPALSELNDAGHKLDVVCVSHIDADHIEGVLKMLDVEVAWQISDAHPAGDGFREPRNPRPCGFDEIWHNGFHEQVGIDTDLAGLPEDAADLPLSFINSMADLVTGTPIDADDHLRSYANLATSVPQALELVARLGDGQVGKTINARFGGELITSAVPPVQLDDLKITFIGPTPDTLDGLKQAWLDEFRKSDTQKTIAKLRKRMADDAENLAAGAAMDEIREARVVLASELGLSEGELGDRTKVTAPNLASLMFVAEDGNSRAIFTGDGAGQDILSGLQAARFLDAGGASSIHVQALKLQHHGAEFNINADFCRRVTADHYLISGNGNHENPDLRVLELIANSRLQGHPDFAHTPEADRPFTIDMAMGPDVVSDAFAERLAAIFDELDNQASRFPPGHVTLTRFENDTAVEIDL